ncbi:hypothetical protein [Lacticaseibacillus rhamnosus]|nr:hypothetical protein [Lacticaseibacillus rhamnosus]
MNQWGCRYLQAKPLHEQLHQAIRNFGDQRMRGVSAKAETISFIKAKA